MSPFWVPEDPPLPGEQRMLSIERVCLSWEPLRRLQADLRRQLPGFRPISLRNLRLMVMHIGSVRELHGELQAEVPGLELRWWWKELRAWLLEWLEEVEADDLNLEPLGLDWAGEAGIAMLRLRPSPRFDKQRQELWQSFQRLLLAVGVKDPEAFVSAGSLLRLSQPGRYTPQVCLGMRSMARIRPASVELPNRVCKFGMMQLRGLEVRWEPARP